jgi:tetratricopeptide (TPR) repeat protein
MVGRWNSQSVPPPGGQMVAFFSFRSLLMASSTVILSIGLIIQVNPVAAQEPLSVRLDALIDQELQRIHIQPRATVSLAEKAAQARQAIEKGDYKSAREIFTDALNASRVQNWRFYPFDDLLSQVSDVIDPAFKTRLDEWVEQTGTDALPVLIRAQYYVDRAWLDRGDRVVRYIARDHLRAFEISIDHALADADTAIGLDSANPYSFYLKVEILAGLGTSQKLVDAFKEAIAKYPDYYPLYDTMLGTLEPKWGGSEQLMYTFVDEYAGKAADDSPLKLLYLALYRDVLDSASISCRATNPTYVDKLMECVRATIQAKPDLEGNVLKAFQLYNHSDHYQFGLAIQYVLFGIMKVADADPYPSVILQLAATTLQSDATSTADGTKQNNYVIDRAAAVSWRSKHSSTIPQQKSQEALLDIAHTQFPSEEERDVAVSKIYMDLAVFTKDLVQPEDMIKYESIATRLGGPNNLEYLICSGYHQLKDDAAAIRSCTQAIVDRPNVTYSYYWRGIAYLKSNQPDAALADLAIVADSENEFRASAALAMATIYFDRSDVQAALNVLNKYEYLYDSHVESKATVASSYDNRCYAYMQLGKLQRALSDCTASLKYGSLPDAYSKQQELDRRLKHPDNL